MLCQLKNDVILVKRKYFCQLQSVIAEKFPDAFPFNFQANLFHISCLSVEPQFFSNALPSSSTLGTPLDNKELGITTALRIEIKNKDLHARPF